MNSPANVKSLTMSVLEHIIALAVFTPLAYVATRLWESQKDTITTVIVIAVCLTLFTAIVARVTAKRTRSAVKKEMASSNIEQCISLNDFEKRTEEHHQFVHIARDLLVKVFANSPLLRRRDQKPIVPVEFHKDLQQMLTHMSNLFRGLLPDGVHVFTAIRERKGSEYSTILRSGDCDSKKRQTQSKSLHKRTKMVEELQESFKNRDCVLKTGSAEPNWQRMPNDDLGQDKSVLMGAVFSKRWEPVKGKDSPVQLEWIICVAADRAGAFSDEHKPLMKCFNDLFSLLLNTFMRNAHVSSMSDEVEGGVGSDQEEAPPSTPPTSKLR